MAAILENDFILVILICNYNIQAQTHQGDGQLWL
jgi:hypothetical protein